jgi:endonuclease/exonuclease/phosphatase (EEP) superfamily protein YafD
MKICSTLHDSTRRRTENHLTSPPPGFLKRLAIAGVNLLTPLHAGLIATYYALRWLGGGDLWFADALGYVLPWLFAPLVVLLPGALLRRSRLLLILAAVPTALFLLTYGHLYLPRLPVRAAGPTFTAMTYNVLYRNRDADLVAASIEAHDPDFFGLRELEPPMAQALESRFADRYPFHKVEPGCGIWSRYPILQYEAFQLGGGEGHWAQQLVLDVNGHGVTVLSVHPRSPPLRGFHPLGLPLGVPTGFANEGRDADMRDLLAHLEEVNGPLIVMGDFNLSDQQGPYAELTCDLLDAHRESGWGMGFTFTRFPRLGLPMWRIDYVFHSPDLVALSTAVGDYGGSDHRPVIARLAFRAGGTRP